MTDGSEQLDCMVVFLCDICRPLLAGPNRIASRSCITHPNAQDYLATLSWRGALRRDFVPRIYVVEVSPLRHHPSCWPSGYVESGLNREPELRGYVIRSLCLRLAAHLHRANFCRVRNVFRGIRRQGVLDRRRKRSCCPKTGQLCGGLRLQHTPTGPI